MNDNKNKITPQEIIAIILVIFLIIGLYFLVKYMETPKEDKSKSYWYQKSTEERTAGSKYKDKYESNSSSYKKYVLI